MRGRGISGYTLGAVLAVFAILLVITLASDILVRVDLHPTTKFGAVAANTVLAGMAATALVEYMGLRVLAN